MIFLVTVLLYIFVIIFIGFIGFMLWCKWHDDQQSVAEPLALEMANILNEDGNVCKMNDMVTCSRQLVYTSRENYENTAGSLDPSFRYFGYLSGQLMNTARTGALELENERRSQLSETKKKLLAYVHDFEFKKRSASAFDNVINPTGSRIIELEVGYVRDHTSHYAATGSNKTSSTSSTYQKFGDSSKEYKLSGGASNAYHTPGTVEGLEQHDTEQNFLDPSTNLYNATAKATIPGDEDVPFVISPAAANVNGQTAPSRLVNEKQFRSMGTLIHDGKLTNLQLEQMPTAIRITIERTAKTLDKNQKIRATATAVSVGAAPPLWEQSGPES